MRMSEAAKKAVPKSERGVPGKSGTGSYPLKTPGERRAAIGLSAMHGTPSFAAKIKAKARKVAASQGAPLASLARAK